MEELKWTKELPATEGWYWWRKSIGESQQILQIRNSELGELRIHFDSGTWPLKASMWKGEWAGPIQLPAENKPEDSWHEAKEFKRWVRENYPEALDASGWIDHRNRDWLWMRMCREKAETKIAEERKMKCPASEWQKLVKWAEETGKALTPDNEEEVYAEYLQDQKPTPSPQKGHPRFYELLDRLRQIHEGKNDDYGRANDPLANLRKAERVGIPNWKGVWLRIEDKISRIETFCNKGVLTNESVDDSLLDMSHYCLLCLILLEEERKSKLGRFVQQEGMVQVKVSHLKPGETVTPEQVKEMADAIRRS